MRPVDEPARARAALAVLDWAGCAVAGAASPAGRLMLDRAAAQGEGTASLVGRTARVAPSAAACGNGALGNVLEMDDVDKRAVLHPGPTVIPAALALAEACGASGPDLLDAVVRGYEAVIRIGRATGPGHYRMWHTTATCGPFGAAAACASLLDLDMEGWTDALGLAGTTAGGLWQTRHEPRSLAKQWHAARAAQSGLDAAAMAQVRFAGPAFILEGPQGLFAAACPDGEVEAVVGAPDAGWAIHDVSIKPWGACRHAHAAIDAALMLRSIDPADIAAIEVVSYPAAVDFCDKRAPATVIEAKFSFQHAVAITLLDGRPPLAAFEPAAIARTDVAALRRLTSVKAGEPYAGAYPARYGAEVAVTLRSGEVHRAAAPDAWGDPENPVSRDDVIAKARDLIAWGGRGADADAIIAAALGLADGASPAALMETLQ